MPFERVLVYGAGATGSFLGGCLSRILPVTLIARREHVEAIKGRGIFIGGKVDIFVPPGRIQATTGVSAITDGCLVLVTVKLTAVAQAGRELTRLARPDTLFLLTQNGLLGRDLFLEGAGRELPVVRAVASCGVDFREAGKIDYWGGGLVIEQGARSSELAGLLRSAGIEAEESADFSRTLWSKLASNCAINPITALLEVRNAGAMAPELDRLRLGLVAEVAELARAEGVALEADLAERISSTLVSGGNRSSMLQDLLYGRPTEIEFLNGFVARRAAELGLAAPLNSAMADLIRAKEAAGRPRV